jgi:hypothetical protein
LKGGIKMKKLIIVMVLTVSMIGFSEKLNTDGRDHLDKVVGSFGVKGNLGFKIVKKGSKLEFVADNVINGPVSRINKYLYLVKLVIDTGEGFEREYYCFAYDIKYKKLVNVDCRNLNIIQILDKGRK